MYDGLIYFSYGGRWLWLLILLSCTQPKSIVEIYINIQAYIDIMQQMQISVFKFLFFFIYFTMYLFTYIDVQHYFNIRWCLCRLITTRRLPLVKQELLLNSLGFRKVRVAKSLVVFCVMFRWTVFVFLNFGHCFVCFSIYDFLLNLWYL